MSSEKVILKSSEDEKFEIEEAVVMSSEKKKMIILKSSDDEKFEIEEAVALQSETLEHLIEDGCADDFIPLPNVNSKILRMVIDYCNKHHENSNPNNEKLKKWDAEFVKVDQPTLFELILAANYLTIKGLLDLTCQTVANMVKGKTTEEMRQLFGIKNDFTPEEEEELKRENQWAFN